MANYFKKDIIFGIGILFVTLAVGLYIIALLYNYERAIEKEVEEVASDNINYEPAPTRIPIIETDYQASQDSADYDDETDYTNENEEYEEYEDQWELAIYTVGGWLYDLENQLQEMISGFGGEYSIYVYNLNTMEYLIINNKSCVPASLLKLFNMAAVFEQIENGQLEHTSQINSWLYDMIVISCNDSYNNLLVAMGNGDLLGGARFATSFSHEQGFIYTSVGGTLTPSIFDDLHFANILTSVEDVGNLMKMIYQGTLVSERASGQMLDILLSQQILNKIPAGLPPGTIFASKTGEIPNYEHDAAIIYSEGADFVLVIKSRYDGFAIGNIHTITNAVYRYFNP